MCGIAGVVVWDERYRVTRETLSRMSAAIAHRGPDGEAFHITREHERIDAKHPQVAFAFRRLAVIDPDPRSMQPMTIDHLTMVFNGEIYNYKDLKSEISDLRPDYQWKTTGDGEVLLMSYIAWGEKCVEHLNGMFAIAIWDARDKSLFLARDRMGQKPLYLAKPYCGPTTPVIAFASEFGALQVLGWTQLPESLNRDSLREFLQYGCVSPETTIYHDVEQSAPALLQIEHYNGKRCSGRIYFNPAAPTAAQSAAAGGIPTTTRALIQQAVRRQLVSDVPLGCFLSGGIDSSVIASCMRRESGEVHTFSIGFDDPRYDESTFAREVARHLGTKHHEFVVKPDAVADLPALARVFGEPFADSSALPTHYLARETRKHVTVALSGDGGDELFGGYDRYRAIALSQRLEQLVPWFAARRMGRFAGGHPKSRLTRAGRLFASLKLPAHKRYASYLRIFDDALITELLVEPIPEFDHVANCFESCTKRGMSPAQAAALTDRYCYLPADLLTKVDRCSMLHALEVRSPFMDHELVQFAAGLTTDQLLKGGPKRMLREAFASDLPDFVFKRKKMGFAVPIGEWFRTDANLNAMLRESLSATNSFARAHFNMKVVERLIDDHMSQRVDHSQRLYALLMLELWWDLQRT